MMLQELKNVTWALKALGALNKHALAYAQAEGLEEVGAEHYLLAAFDLPEETAARTFAKLGLDRDRLRVAIEQHYAQALRSSGLAVALPPPVPITRALGAWAPLPMSASAKALLDRLSEQDLPADALCGAQVILAALSARHGVVPRVLRLCGIEKEALEASAKAERDAYHSSR